MSCCLASRPGIVYSGAHTKETRVHTFTNLVLVFAVAVPLVGADVSGKWKATFTAPGGETRENIITLQAEGDKLTGTVSGRMGEAKIQDGTVNGDEVTFVVVRSFNGEDVKITYKGKVTGNKMALKVSARDREFDVTATRE
ncbi:MAG TPA: hypothetical protein VFL57_17550 [Bryobacteraceae bacterium]|nr:hypothetical protein [Bryobacteraceae bacterium]